MLHKQAITLLMALMFALASNAKACSRQGGPPSEADTIKTADEIFIAHLVSAAEFRPTTEQTGKDVQNEPFQTMVEGQYVLIESLKGATEKNGIVHDAPFAPGNCSLGLMPGWDYVFFVKHDPERPWFRWVGMFTGSVPLGPYRSGKEEKGLTDLKAHIKQLSESKP